MPRTFSRHQRYLALIALLAVLAVVLVGGGYAVTESERVDVQNDWATTSQLRSDGADLTDSARDQESALDSYLLSTDPDVLAKYDAAVADTNRLLGVVRSKAGELPELTATLTTFESDLATWQTTFAKPAIVAVQHGGGTLLDAFAKGSGSDHEAIDADLLAMTTALDHAEAVVRDRADRLAADQTVTTAVGLGVLLLAAGIAFWLIRRYGRALERDALHAGVLNRFTEVTSFASDDRAVASSNLEALALLVHPDAAVTHVLNRSKDRAVPEAILGDAIAEVLPLNALSQCVGIVRGSMYVANDVSAPLSVHCPVYPVTSGTLACVPLSSGERIGAVHLYWSRPNALDLEFRASVVRIAEHAALAIGNRRLLAALSGQANTDARTGLANSRAFDQALEAELEALAGTERLAVLMLDIDHFKDFNDRHGHPAGDEALRAFAGALRSCVRDGDLAARYGGEEFAVMLPRTDPQTVRAIGERIRARTESTIISLAPGITDRVTVSIGIAIAPDQAVDRITLLGLADEALYRAKQSGRNRVVEYDAAAVTSDPDVPNEGPVAA
jgi:diguanylate cyclase (GGDEF)-like protein